MTLAIMLCALVCWGAAFLVVCRGYFPGATFLGGLGFELFGIFMLVTGHLLGLLVLTLGLGMMWGGRRWMRADKAHVKAKAAKKVQSPQQ